MGMNRHTRRKGRKLARTERADNTAAQLRAELETQDADIALAQRMIRKQKKVIDIAEKNGHVTVQVDHTMPAGSEAVTVGETYLAGAQRGADITVGYLKPVLGLSTEYHNRAGIMRQIIARIDELAQMHGNYQNLDAVRARLKILKNKLSAAASAYDNAGAEVEEHYPPILNEVNAWKRTVSDIQDAMLTVIKDKAELSILADFYAQLPMNIDFAPELDAAMRRNRLMSPARRIVGQRAYELAEEFPQKYGKGVHGGKQDAGVEIMQELSKKIPALVEKYKQAKSAEKTKKAHIELAEHRAAYDWLKELYGDGKNLTDIGTAVSRAQTVYEGLP